VRIAIDFYDPFDRSTLEYQIRTKRRQDQIYNCGEFSNQITEGLIDEKQLCFYPD